MLTQLKLKKDFVMDVLIMYSSLCSCKMFKNNNVWDLSLSLDLCSLYQRPCHPVLDGAKQNTRPFEKLPVKLETHSPVICYSGTQGSTKPTCSGKVATSQTSSV